MRLQVCSCCFEEAKTYADWDLSHYVHLTKCCDARAYDMPDTIYDFYKPDIVRIIDGDPHNLDTVQEARLSYVKDALETYMITEENDED